ncbi:AAA domain-containing protein (plasmid) [Rhizobium etli bv. mimosae str. IE4771]|uniref:AAA domain-containing protein n=1 Tax=Rhizobium etli bv. mimosae str. IE4771 TaxID=1432050 RepID=A0A060I6J6_RHIET|nr:AAA family ATPase [Rhizobium sp. IE4771]AIC29522.1 AAA domain-containing protein [Rhizobium sp. IE4771]
MIHTDRAQVINPLDPATALGRRALDEMEKFAADMRAGRFHQKRPMFKTYKAKPVTDALAQLFHGKCAYCESKISAVAPIDVELFRPKASVVEAPSHPGYWWLANSWDNLLAACIDCNRLRRFETGAEKILSGKGDRFPLIDETARCLMPEDDLSREMPLLLDPTRDFPEEHLVYSKDGIVISESERGNTTIAILGLNRRGLVQQRHQTLLHFHERENYLIEAVSGASDSDAALSLIENRWETLARMARPDAPYSGMIRQALERTRARLSREISPDGGVDFAGSAPRVTKERERRAQHASRSYAQAMSDYSLEDDAGIAKFKSQRRFVERVTIENIKAIKNLDLNFEALSHGPSPWLMLLGENGTGKSTVLQSIALALCDSDQLLSLLKNDRIDPASMVRYRCKSGRVTVKLSGFPKAHELIVYRDRFELRSPQGDVAAIKINTETVENPVKAQVLILGYGATRLLPRRRSSSDAGAAFSRIDNLFDPFVALIDAEAWLLKRDPKDFGTTAMVLKDLLALDDEAEFVTDGRTIFVRSGDAKTPLRNLSDGYQTVVAAAVDILSVLSRIWEKLTEAEGIVLIDEIDAHLHPRWQMRIVGSLRNAMPGVQFITTTHQPLCLRGLGAGEVVVMQRDEEGVVEPLLDLPSPADFRVDQLLTSGFFGLRSTVDPETERLFDTYYALLALDDRTAEQESELESLQAELAGRRQLGDTQRESIYYAAIDKLLAKQATPARLPPETLREEAVEQIGALWTQMLSKAEAGE